MWKGVVRYFTLVILLIVLAAMPAVAAVRDAFLGDVLLIAWLEEDLIKVALANDSYSRQTITLAPFVKDQPRQSSLVDRTVVVPARTVVIEAFPLTVNLQGAPLGIEASAWNYRATIEVQTGDIFQPNSYLVREQEDVEVRIDLGFLFEGIWDPNLSLSVDDYYRGWVIREPGRIWIKTIDGGFRQGRPGNTIQFAKPQMLLGMEAPRTKGDSAVFTFSLYEQRPRGYRDYYQKEIPGPSILVYSRNMKLQDNSHLSKPLTPTWEWRSNY